MKKRLSSLLLALCLLGTLGMAPLALAEEMPHMEISYVSWNCGEIVDDNWAETLLQERFNVEIKTTRVDLSNSTQVSLMLASGEMPECGWQMGTPSTLYDQGLTRTIPEAMIREYAPNYAALLDANPIGWKYFTAQEEGAYIGLTGFSASINAYMLAIRLDWMENLGLDLPEDMVALNDDETLMVTSTPYTMSELYDILHAFTYDDPDGNGENDTVGLAACNGLDQFYWMPLFSAYGMMMSRAAVEVDGQAEAYYASPQYYALLEYMAKAYADGLVDKEFATVDRQTAWEKYLNGRTGVSGAMGAWASTLPGFATRPPMSIVSAGTGKILLTPSPTEDGKENTSPAYTFTPFSFAFTVRADVSDEKLARILTMFDYINFDPEAKVIYRYGIEGEHFDFENPQTRTGIILREGVANGGDTGLMVYNSNYIMESDIGAMITNEMTQRLTDAFMGEYMQEQAAKPYRVDVFNTSRLAELTDLYGATINALVEEYFYNVICGEVDLASSWDGYIQTLNQAGYDEIHAEWQNVPLFSDLVK